MELVGHGEDVGVSELHSVGDVLLNASAGVEDELNPALLALCSDVVLDGSTDLALSASDSVNESVGN